MGEGRLGKPREAVRPFPFTDELEMIPFDLGETLMTLAAICAMMGNWQRSAIEEAPRQADGAVAPNSDAGGRE